VLPYLSDLENAIVFEGALQMSRFTYFTYFYWFTLYLRCIRMSVIGTYEYS